LKRARATFGTRKPESLKKGELEDWRLDISAGSRHDVFRAFRQALAWASDRDRGLLERNPSDGIPNPKRPKHERAEVRPFESWNEVESVCAELDARYRALVVTMVGCGLRPEEACGLHRSDVDREKMQLHVRRLFTQGVVKAGSKTDAGRIVPFGQRVLAALDAMPPRIDTPILFPAPRGGYIDIEKLRHREWAPALRAAGLEHHRLYDLRHTHITWALQGNQPVAVVAKNAGTSIAQLDATYSRPTEDASKAVAEAVDSYAV
jgi:integrase